MASSNRTYYIQCPYCGMWAHIHGKPGDEEPAICMGCDMWFYETVPDESVMDPEEIQASATDELQILYSSEVGHALQQLLVDIPDADETSLAQILRLLTAARRHRVPRSDEPVSLSKILPVLRRFVDQLKELESHIEQRLHALLVEADMMGEFDQQREIKVQFVQDDGTLAARDTTPDFVHRALPFAIYCDGSPFHSKAPQRERDHGVADALQDDGWRVLRLTGDQILSRPEKCLAQIRRALSSLRPR